MNYQNYEEGHVGTQENQAMNIANIYLTTMDNNPIWLDGFDWVWWLQGYTNNNNLIECDPTEQSFEKKWDEEF